MNSKQTPASTADFAARSAALVARIQGAAWPRTLARNIIAAIPTNSLGQRVSR